MTQGSGAKVKKLKKDGFVTLKNKDDKKTLPWILMGILTIVQVLGNVFSSYRYMILHNTDQIDYFTKSVLFFVQSPNPDYNYVMISYITGAILPVVALCMTSMVASMLKRQHPEPVVTNQGEDIVAS